MKEHGLRSRGLVLALGLGLAPVIFILMIVLLLDRQMALAAAERERQAGAVLSFLLQSRANAFTDYAVWDENYARIVLGDDEAWFQEEQGAEMGPTAFYKATLVIDETGRPVMGSWGEEAGIWDPLATIGPDFPLLLDRVLAGDGAPRTFFVGTASGVHVVAIGEILPHLRTEMAEGVATRRLLLWMDPLGEERVEELRELLGWPDFKIARARPEPPHLAIIGPRADVVGYVSWSPSTVVTEAMKDLAPLGGAALLATFGGLVSVWRVMQRSTRDLLLAERRARELALSDPLTRLPNRRALQQALEARHAAGAHFRVLVIDFDGFKEINDRYGHEQGDALLAEMSTRMSRLVGERGLLARMGGDEFAVLLEAGAAEATELGRDLVFTISQPFTSPGQSLSISASIGHAESEPGLAAEEVLRRADIAMYAAKEERCGAVRAYSPDMEQDRLLLQALDREMREGLDRGEFWVAYQPLFSVTEDRIVGVEALLRWTSPERGEIAPSLFIPVAERSRFINVLGEFALATACAAVAARPGLRLAVNLSPVQLLDDRLVPKIERILAETGLEAGRLEFEITEGYLVEQEDRALRVLDRVRALGVRISLDDFGTGYASIGYLKRFPIDKIKLDRSLILAAPRDPKAREVASAVVALCRALSLPITAEGVETLEQAAFLTAAGCDCLQGYMIGRPAAHLPEEGAARLRAG